MNEKGNKWNFCTKCQNIKKEHDKVVKNDVHKKAAVV